MRKYHPILYGSLDELLLVYFININNTSEATKTDKLTLNFEKQEQNPN